MGVWRGIVGRKPMLRKQGIGQGKRLPGIRINDQEFFLDAEGSHAYIVRQRTEPWQPGPLVGFQTGTYT